MQSFNISIARSGGGGEGISFCPERSRGGGREREVIHSPSVCHCEPLEVMNGLPAFNDISFNLIFQCCSLLGDLFLNTSCSCNTFITHTHIYIYIYIYLIYTMTKYNLHILNRQLCPLQWCFKCTFTLFRTDHLLSVQSYTSTI